MVILSATSVGFSVFCWCIDVFDDDRRYDGCPSRCLLAALWTASRHITTPEPASLCYVLAVLHGFADGRAARSVSLLPRTSIRHLLGSVSRCRS